MSTTAIIPFGRQHIDQATRLFRAAFERLRSAVPTLPDTVADVERLAAGLDQLSTTRPGFAAVRDDRLVGYLGWITIDDFRATGRRAAYVPAWGHATTPHDRAEICRLLYQTACREWTSAGCRAHAIALLAGEPDTERAFCWEGFGITVVDAIRAIGEPAGVPVPGVNVREARPSDSDALAALEAEHWQHYTRPPVLMAAQAAPTLDEIRQVLDDSAASYWLATTATRPIGFLHLANSTHGASDIVSSPETITISGAFVQPAHRGRRVATALLDAALRAYAGRGYRRCSVDFESFNPEARGFWLRSFVPVCVSMVRYPELAPTAG